MKTIGIPRLKKLNDTDQLYHYSETYFASSGLSVPIEYLNNRSNRVYGIFFKKEIVGGFVLGSGKTLRTLELFAQPQARRRLYDHLGEMNDYTEITCFWMAPKCRKDVILNTIAWLYLAFALNHYGGRQVIFGTCSTSLSRLYNAGRKSVLIHEDQMNGKNTYIFHGDRRASLQAFWLILRYKWARLARIKFQAIAVLFSIQATL